MRPKSLQESPTQLAWVVGGSQTSAVDAGSSALAASTGTLDVTFSILNGTNEVTLEVTANSSLTTTTLDILYTVQNDSTQGIAIV